jgi:drug/metabolite transporter (DMT)-like permease
VAARTQPAVHRPARLDLGLLAVAVVAVSTSAPLVRASSAPTLSIAFWRNALALPVLGAALLIAHRREVGALDGREVRLIVAAGVVLGAHFATWIPSLSFTSVASSVALVATQPVWAALVARARGEHVPRAVWSGVAIAVAGAVALSGVDLSISARALFGDALALAGGILAAVYVTIGADVRRTVSTTVYATGCYAVAAATLLVICLVTGQAMSGYDGDSWLAIAGLVVGAQLLGHTLVNRVLRTTSATVVSVAILFEILGAALLAWIFFDEAPPEAAWPAGIGIAAGVVMVVRAGREPAAPLD